MKYEVGGVKVSIGTSQDVAVPPEVHLGRASCMHFDTDKAFLLPPSVPGVRNIVAFITAHPAFTVLVNGHTDLVGDGEYNRKLSCERAAALTAYLRDQVDEWLSWYDAPIQSKRWGTLEDQYMLATVSSPAGVPYYAGDPNGANDAATRDAVGRFQTDHGCKVDQQAGPETRRALIAEYMKLEGTSIPPSTTVVQHGCGKTHPIDATPDADEGNRRVEIFLFDGAVDPAPQDPCPLAGCTQYATWVDQAGTEIDLCADPPPDTRKLLIKLIDDDQKPRNGVDYVLEVAGQKMSGTTGEDGMIAQDIPAGATDGTLTYDDYTRTVSIESMGEPVTAAGARPRLRNLGFGGLVAAAADATRLAVMRFQERNELEPTGELDTATADKLKDRHGS